MALLRRAMGAVLAAAAISLTPVAAADAAAGADQPAIIEFWLIDTETDTRIRRLDDYDSLRLPMLPSALSIEAVATDGTDSVIMEIDHAHSSTENLAPYALRGDASGDFNPAPELRIPGWLTVSANPFAGPDGTGTAGTEVDLHLYLSQPDFVVRNAADVGDFEPGDGYCSTVKVPVPPDDLAVAPVSDLPDGERKLVPDLTEPSPRQIDGVKAPDESGGAKLGDEDDPRRSLARLQPAIEIDHIIRKAETPIDSLIAEWFPVEACTLRAAVEEANALPGRQSIVIDSAVGPFELSEGTMQIVDGVDLIGHGPRALIDGMGSSRIFDVSGDHLVNMNRLDLRRGQAGRLGRGGAMSIDDDAFVQMSDSIVRESQANFGGGIALQTGGALRLTGSAMHHNVAGTPEDGIDGGGQTQRGGAIFNNRSNVTIIDSSIHENVAVRGGGLSNFGGTIRVENSSVIDNEALAIGGGIENRDNLGEHGNLHLSFATVAHNRAGTHHAPPPADRVGGGLYNTGWAYIASSILAANTDAYSAGDPLHAPDCHSPGTHDFKTYGPTLIGVVNDNCDVGPGYVTSGSEAAPLDVKLTGKFPFDHRHYRQLLSDSPAVDAAASASASLYPCDEHDMRGMPRPVGAGCDIGAVERQ